MSDYFKDNPSAFVSYMRTNCIPAGLSKTQPLFYVGYPRADIMQFPIVAIIPTGGVGSRMSLGDTGNRYMELYTVDIYTDTDAYASVGQAKYAQSELVNHIAAAINRTIRDNRCDITSTLNWIDIWISSPVRSMPYNEDRDLYRGTLRLYVQYNDPRT